MPTVLIQGGFRFGFYSSDLAEPPHVHAKGSGGEAKIWLDPIELVLAFGLTESEKRKIIKIVTEHQNALCVAWEKAKGRDDL